MITNHSSTSALNGAKPHTAPGTSPAFDLPVTLRIACLHLRHKLMYVDERHAQRGLIDNSSDTRVFWCCKTQGCLGPDHDAVGPDACSRSRECYCHGA